MGHNLNQRNLGESWLLDQDKGHCNQWFYSLTDMTYHLKTHILYVSLGKIILYGTLVIER
jgi:hypothetical protein